MPDHPLSNPELEQAMLAILRPHGESCAVQFEPDRVTLIDSYRVRSRADRMKLCRLLAESDLTERSAESLCAEWRMHNAAYALHIRRSSAKDADLDYQQDSRRLVRAVTGIFEFLHLY